MTCAYCGLPHSAELCAHHGSAFPPTWAAENRAICDLIHRGKPPARVAWWEREHAAEDIWWPPSASF